MLSHFWRYPIHGSTMRSLRSFIHQFEPFVRTLALLLRPTLLFLVILLGGTLGFRYIEDYSWMDAVYLTVITISTVGYETIRPLHDSGKVFVVFLILGGVVFYGVAVQSIIQLVFQEKLKEFLHQAKTMDQLKKITDHVIICGGGRMAQAIAVDFSNHQTPFVIIEQNEANNQLFEQKGYLYLTGSALDEEVLQTARIDTARALISVLPTDADNLFVVLSARDLRPDINIITRINYESARKKMLMAGANTVISPYHLGGIQMARRVLNPDVDEFMEVMLGTANFDFLLKVEDIPPGHELIGQKIRDSKLRAEGYLVISVRRKGQNEIFAPSPDYTIQPGDQILMIATSKDAPDPQA